jgi:hypothetical protein
MCIVYALHLLSLSCTLEVSDKQQRSLRRHPQRHKGGESAPVDHTDVQLHVFFLSRLHSRQDRGKHDAWRGAAPSSANSCPRRKKGNLHCCSISVGSLPPGVHGLAAPMDQLVCMHRGWVDRTDMHERRPSTSPGSLSVFTVPRSFCCSSGGKLSKNRPAPVISSPPVHL